MASSVQVIGLDLGTLHLRPAAFLDGKVELIKDELGNDSIPAYVGFSVQSESDKAPAARTTVLGRHAYDLAQRETSHTLYTG